jgi:adenylate kinase family enzyme
MEKIAIIGSNGAGKTTLAKELSCILKIKVYHLDRLLWQPGWKRKDRETRIDILQKLSSEKQWIIEGSYLRSSGPRLQVADTIIFLDIPFFKCFLQVLKRHRKYSGLSRRDIPERCTEKLTLLRLFKVLAFPLGERRKLMKILHQFPSEKVIQLHSTREVEAFLLRLGLHADDNCLLSVLSK